MSAAKPLSALILAAGQSRRFGGGKLRAQWNGRPLILWTLEAALAAPVSEVILVWGGDPLILPLLPTDRRLKTVRCDNHLDGMGASLAAGLRAIDPKSLGAYIFLGDMPRVPTLLMETMATGLEGQVMALAPQFDDRRGHPVLLSAALFPKLLTLNGDQGAGAVLKTLDQGLILVPAPDDGCLFDIDRPDDLDVTSTRP